MKDWLEKHAYVPLQKMLRILLQLGIALQYLHAQNLMHRDLKYV